MPSASAFALPQSMLFWAPSSGAPVIVVSYTFDKSAESLLPLACLFALIAIDSDDGPHALPPFDPYWSVGRSNAPPASYWLMYGDFDEFLPSSEPQSCLTVICQVSSIVFWV